MYNIGKQIIIGNPEDVLSLRLLEIINVYEVSINETYYEFIDKPIIKRVGSEVVKRGGL